MLSKLFNKREKLPYNDLFIDRLSSSVTGGVMLDEGNLFLMDYALRNAPQSDNMVEIGSWGGMSTNLLLHLMKKYGRTERFLGCDPWIYEGYRDIKGLNDPFIDGRDDLTRLEYMKYIKNSFISSVSLFHSNRLPYTFHMTSDSFFESFQNNRKLKDVFERTHTPKGRISFCYIDGNHSYDFAKRDFENTDKLLVDNGMILFDDSWDGSPFGSTLLMQEIKKNPKYRVLKKNPNYLVQKIN